MSRGLRKNFSALYNDPNRMINLITIDGRSAHNFYLASPFHPDFKSLTSAVTSGKVMFVSTKFRSDLFYCSELDQHQCILKLWAFYANKSLNCLDVQDYSFSIGNEASLTKYFESINQLSTNWLQYQLYQKAFDYSLHIDQQNPVAKIIVQCDQHLIGNPTIKRCPLVENDHHLNSQLSKDTFSMAMHLINNESHSN